MQYCENPLVYRRRATREVMVGNVGVGGANPIGKRFRVRVDPGQTDPIYEIVGLVEDMKYNSLRDPFVPIIFLPESQDADPDGNLRLVIRSGMPTANVILPFLSKSQFEASGVGA